MDAPTLTVVEFVLFGAVSLGFSALFVVRLERIGAGLHLSEAILGLFAALGADSPEITSAVTAVTHHQRGVAVGVLVGSNIFNLAVLLGLGALLAGRIALHRRVVVLAGLPAMLVMLLTLGMEHGSFGRWPVAIVLFGFLVPYLSVLGSPERTLHGLRVPASVAQRITLGVIEEEHDLASAIRPSARRQRDIVVATLTLAVVVIASVLMERLGSTIGRRNHWSALVVGAVVLAGVTSLPNCVASFYLAGHGRGAAALSTALHSNTINVAAGLVIPALFVGIGQPTAAGVLLAWWYFAMTVAILGVAYWRRGLGRWSGTLIVLAYGVCLWTMIGH